MLKKLREGTLKGRRDYWCFDCCRTIPKGERHYAQVIICDEDIYTLRVHEDCRDAALHYTAGGYMSDYDDGIPPLIEMVWNGDGQRDLDDLRGHFPHVVCRIELGEQLAEIARQDRLARIKQEIPR